jgi:hypothetical protein
MLPTFLIIGGARCGTTVLFEYLDQHPEVFTCEPKEPHFLAFAGTATTFKGPGDEIINARSITDFKAYEKLFAAAGTAKAIGEGSVTTLYYREAIANIRRYVPSARLICILRNPMDRALSAFSYMRSRMFEPLESFEEALAAEDGRIAAGWQHLFHYKRGGLYYEQLARFFDAFGREQIQVILYDDLIKDSLDVVRRCLSFIGVDAGLLPTRLPIPLASGEPRSPRLQRLLVYLAPAKYAVERWLPQSLQNRIRTAVNSNLVPHRMQPGTRRQLSEEFGDDIVRLEKLIDRDLSHWLQ